MLTEEHLSAAYKSVLGVGGAVYCSAPITSGRLYLEWLREFASMPLTVDEVLSEHRAEHFARVIQPNISRAASATERLRAMTDLPVIDPTAVPHINGWTQDKWLSFWERIISEFAVAIVALDGWSLSFGCAHEVLYGFRLGLPVYDERLKRLTPRSAGSTISKGLVELQDLSLPTTKLIAVSDALGQLLQSSETSVVSFRELRRRA
jgi:hypothetical protein